MTMPADGSSESRVEKVDTWASEESAVESASAYTGFCPALDSALDYPLLLSRKRESTTDP